MEESINKKSILILFFSLILIFLFLYNGLILTGDTYLKEYTEFRNNTIKTSGMKKPKNAQKDKIKDLNRAILTDVLINLANIQLELTALNHEITNKQQLSSSLIDSIYNYTNTTYANETVKKLFEKFNNTKLQNTSIDKITDNLELNMALLRNISNYV